MKMIMQYIIAISSIMIVAWICNGFQINERYVQLFTGITACTALVRTCKGE